MSNPLVSYRTFKKSLPKSELGNNIHCTMVRAGFTVYVDVLDIHFHVYRPNSPLSTAKDLHGILTSDKPVTPRTDIVYVVKDLSDGVQCVALYYKSSVKP